MGARKAELVGAELHGKPGESPCGSRAAPSTSLAAQLPIQELEAAQVPSATALSLALPRLSALRCRVGRVTDSLLAAVLAPPRLERLALEAPRMHPLAGATAALVTALQELRLCSSQLPGNLCDQLAALQRLTRLVRRGAGAGEL